MFQLKAALFDTQITDYALLLYCRIKMMKLKYTLLIKRIISMKECSKVVW